MSDRRPAALTPLFTSGLDFQKVLRRISYGAGRPRATSSRERSDDRKCVCASQATYFTDDVHTVYHVHHSNPSDQTTVLYLVSVLARIRFKHLCKCNCKLLDLKKGLLHSCVYQIIQRLATGRFCQEIGTYSCYFSFD